MCYRRLDSKISLEQSNVCFKVIGQAFHELWHYETRHVNASLHVVLLHFIQDSAFLIMRI